MLLLTVALGVLLEWLIYVIRPLWRVRRYAIAVPLILTSFGVTALAFSQWRPLSVLVFVTGMFRVINHLRIAKGRMHEDYLRRTVLRSGLILGILQVLFAAAPSFDTAYFLPSLAGVQFAVASALLLITVRNILRTKHKMVLQYFADRELPTVTIAIPARNETAELEDCLRSVLANDYPKFEVLVLDDCSHDRTPEVIKHFANNGVRFVQGAEPSERWLAKNQAYDKLAAQANGEIILFCGVDVRFGPQTIRALVTTMLNRKKSMISVMPRRLSSDLSAAFIQPMRYWWELALPRRYFNRPPVLSTCWLINRKALKKLGGFQAVQHAILPEGYFARELVKTDGYSFVRADEILDVQTRKGMQQQRETAVRMRYPQIRRRLEMAMLLMVTNIALLLGPFIVLLTSFWLGFGAVQVVALVAAALLVLTHVLIVQVSDPANVLVGVINYPLAVLTELALGMISMYKYEFSAVDWKGRNICLPVMHVIPRLPAITDKRSPHEQTRIRN